MIWRMQRTKQYVTALVFLGAMGLSSEGGSFGEETSGSGAASVLTPEGRLAKAISLSVTGEPVKTLLTTLSETSGVTLKAGEEIADRKITAVLQEVELRRFLSGLAPLLSAVWSHPDADTYLLSRNQEQQEKIEKLCQTAQEMAHQQLVQDIHQTATEGPSERRMMDVPVETPEQLERFRQELQGRALILATLSEEEMKRLFQGERLRFRLSDLEGERGQRVLDFAQEFVFPEETGWPEDTAQKAWIEFSSNTYTTFFRSLVLPDVGFLFFTEQGPASAYNFVLDPEQYVEALCQLEEVKALALPLPQEETEGPGVASLDRPLPDTLQFGVMDTATFDELLRQVAKACHLNVVSDFFTELPQGIPIAPPMTVAQALKAMGDEFGRDSWMEGGCCFFRKQTWWLDESVEVPDRVWRPWEEAVHGEGYLSLATLEAIHRLTPGQRERLALLIPEVQILRQPFTGPWLKIFFQLTEEQRQRALSPEGLAVEDLPAESRQWLDLLVQPSPVEDGRLFYTIEVTVKVDRPNAGRTVNRIALPPTGTL